VHETLVGVMNLKITKKNLREIAERIIAKQTEIITKCVKENKCRPLPYYNIAVIDNSGASPLMFSHIVQVFDEKMGVVIDTLFSDYEKMLKLLLSHPHVKELFWNEKKNCIEATFEVPQELSEEDEDDFF